MSGSLAVGFVGLGRMGRAMALRLAASDHALLVHDVAPEPVAELVAAGARAAVGPDVLAAECDVVCVMVRDDEQVREVVDRLLGSARPGLVVAIHSTVAPGTPAELAALARGRSVHLVDAPVSGGPVGAADGRLALMVGADDETFERCRDVLACLGAKVVHAGPVGAGTRFKLARNLVTFTGLAAAAEALRLAEAAGLDLTALGDVVRHTDAISGGAGSIMLRDTAAPPPPGDFWHQVLADVVSLGEKDLTHAVELAGELGVEVPVASSALDRLAAGFGLPGGRP